MTPFTWKVKTLPRFDLGRATLQTLSCPSSLVEVGVLVAVNVGVLVGVSVGVLVGVLVGVSVGVFVGVLVGVSVGVLVGVFVGVSVGVLVGVLVEVLPGQTWLKLKKVLSPSEVAEPVTSVSGVGVQM